MVRNTRRRRNNHRGGGVQTSAQWFDPTAYPPSAGFAAPLSSAPTNAMIRPVMESTLQTGGSRRRRSGGGYQMSSQWFTPSEYPPSAGIMAVPPSSAPTPNAVRPALVSTFPEGQMGGSTRRNRRNRRHMSGGFSPSVMGGFVANAQAVAVPLVLYLAYHTMVPKKGNNKTRKSSRK